MSNVKNGISRMIRAIDRQIVVAGRQSIKRKMHVLRELFWRNGPNNLKNWHDFGRWGN